MEQIQNLQIYNPSSILNFMPAPGLKSIYGIDLFEIFCWILARLNYSMQSACSRLPVCMMKSQKPVHVEMGNLGRNFIISCWSFFF